jgi:predicted metal-dependent phosphoesterase TrpH
VKPLPIKIDLHVHTRYSRDCSTNLEDVLFYSKRKGLSGVAITDHDSVEGALRLLEMENDGLTIIPGIEVSTVQGHILGLNVTTPIRPGLSARETVDRIHEVGGIAVAAHPSAMFKAGIGLSGRTASYGLDAVEVINSSLFPFSLMNYMSKRLAVRLGLPQTAGSDSHIPETIGLAYTVMENTEPEVTVQKIIHAVKKGRIVPFGKPVPWRLRLRKFL